MATLFKSITYITCIECSRESYPSWPALSMAATRSGTQVKSQPHDRLFAISHKIQNLTSSLSSSGDTWVKEGGVANTPRVVHVSRLIFCAIPPATGGIQVLTKLARNADGRRRDGAGVLGEFCCWSLFDVVSFAKLTEWLV